MRDCGNCVFTKTAGGSEVARVNKFTSYACIQFALYSNDNMVNATVLRRVNDDIVSKGGGKSEFTRELLHREFSSHYGVDNPVRTDVAVFNVKLELESECTRVLAIPIQYTVYDLHMALQRLFLWKEYHLHKFCDYDAYDRNLVIDDMELYEYDIEEMEQAERYMTIEELLNKSHKFTYYYDFGAGWETTVKLQRIENNSNERVPHCIAAIGDAPPEDAGGPGGFARIQDIMKNPDNEEYAEMAEWLDYMRWEPLNVEGIQRMLKLYFD